MYSIIAGPNQHNVAVVVPAFPEKCEFVRVVRFLDARRTQFREIALWTAEEWGPEDTDLSCFGAIAGAIKAVNDNDSFFDNEHEKRCEWEDWA